MNFTYIFNRAYAILLTFIHFAEREAALNIFN